MNVVCKIVNYLKINMYCKELQSLHTNQLNTYQIPSETENEDYVPLKRNADSEELQQQFDNVVPYT